MAYGLGKKGIVIGQRVINAVEEVLYIVTHKAHALLSMKGDCE